MEFTLEGTRLDKVANAVVILIVIDLDLPVLIVNINERFLNQLINVNENVKFDISLQDKDGKPTENTKNLYYSGAIMYKFEIVAAK